MLDQRIDEMREDILRSVGELVRIPSVGGGAEGDMVYGRGVQEALDYTLDLAAGMGFRTVNHDNMVGYAEYGQGEEMIAVLGHIDVVPEGEGWTYPPFGAEIHDGRIWGRGTLDDKGAVVGALYALKAIRDLSIPLKRRIRVIFGTNEERGSHCVRRYNEVDEQPVAGFTPDADYPIIFAEKGILNTIHRCKFRETEQAAGPGGPAAAETGGFPTREYPTGAAWVRTLAVSGGTAPNSVPGEARAVLAVRAGVFQEELARLSKAAEAHPKIRLLPSEEKGRISVRAEGISAHGSAPETGENAVITLLAYLAEILAPGEERDAYRFLLQAVGRETNGESLGIQMEDEVSGGLSVNLGTFSKSDGQAELCLNIRYPVTRRAEDFAVRLRAAMVAGGFSTEIAVNNGPVYAEKDSWLIKALQKVYKEKTGREPELLAIGGGTYAKAMKNIVAFGPLFPGREDTAHQADENIRIDDLILNVKIMAAAMAELAR